MKMKPLWLEYKRIIGIKIKNVDLIRMSQDLNIPKKRIRSVLKNFEPKHFDDALDYLYQARSDKEKDIAIIVLSKFYLKNKSLA